MSTLSQFIRELRGQDYLILDTETTGLQTGEIVEICVINQNREILLNTRIKPKLPIPSDASAIHAIYDKDVENSPNFPAISDKLLGILQGHNVIIYNAVYDRKMMHQTAERWEMPKTVWKELAKFYCAMEAFAEYFGDYNSYRGNFRWQKLTTAAAVVNFNNPHAHSALGDCLTTAAVVEMLLKQNPEKYEAENPRHGSDDYEY